jgi:serine/threonine protein phosphatase PrpC
MFDIAVVSEIGRRAAMEDTYWLQISSDGSEIFGGVYDGHGGKVASEYARNNLHKLYFEALKAGKSEAQAFKIAYEQTSKALSYQDSGTTAVNFYIKGGTIFFAHAGDTRLIIIEDSAVKQLTKDHRLTNPQERQRVLAAGARLEPPYVFKNGAGLMPTRTVGDEYFKDVGIIATPETGSYQLAKQDRWILAGTDGLFDEMANEEIRTLIDGYDGVNKAAQILKNEVLVNRLGSDNLTFVFLKVKN